MRALEQRHLDTLRELVEVCDVTVGDDWTHRLRERFGTDRLEDALAAAVGNLVAAAKHVIQDIDT